jgi:hypothetical protein
MNIVGYTANLRHWRQSCDQVFAPLKEFAQRLLDDVELFSERGDRNGAEVAYSSCITCLIYLAILCEVICRVDPIARIETWDICDWALRKAGKLTSTVELDDCCHLDLLLGVR